MIRCVLSEGNDRIGGAQRATAVRVETQCRDSSEPEACRLRTSETALFGRLCERHCTNRAIN